MSIDTFNTMDRIKQIFKPPKASDDEYERLTIDSDTLEGSTYEDDEAPFSWIEYFIFAMIGVAMLWAWYVLCSVPKLESINQS